MNHDIPSDFPVRIGISSHELQVDSDDVFVMNSITVNRV